jgi:hypothetical protein
MMLRRVCCMMRGMQMVAMRYVRMMCSLLVVARLVMLGCVAVMACCMLVMLCSKIVVFAGLL